MRIFILFVSILTVASALAETDACHLFPYESDSGLPEVAPKKILLQLKKLPDPCARLSSSLVELVQFDPNAPKKTNVSEVKKMKDLVGLAEKCQALSHKKIRSVKNLYCANYNYAFGKYNPIAMDISPQKVLSQIESTDEPRSASLVRAVGDTFKLDINDAINRKYGRKSIALTDGDVGDLKLIPLANGLYFSIWLDTSVKGAEKEIIAVGLCGPKNDPMVSCLLEFSSSQNSVPSAEVDVASGSNNYNLPLNLSVNPPNKTAAPLRKEKINFLDQMDPSKSTLILLDTSGSMDQYISDLAKSIEEFMNQRPAGKITGIINLGEFGVKGMEVRNTFGAIKKAPTLCTPTMKIFPYSMDECLKNNQLESTIKKIWKGGDFIRAPMAEAAIEAKRRGYEQIIIISDANFEENLYSHLLEDDIKTPYLGGPEIRKLSDLVEGIPIFKRSDFKKRFVDIFRGRDGGIGSSLPNILNWSAEKISLTFYDAFGAYAYGPNQWLTAKQFLEVKKLFADFQIPFSQELEAQMKLMVEFGQTIGVTVEADLARIKKSISIPVSLVQFSQEIKIMNPDAGPPPGTPSALDTFNKNKHHAEVWKQYLDQIFIKPTGGIISPKKAVVPMWWSRGPGKGF